MAPSENAAAAVAVAQFAPGDDTAANLAEITRLAELAVARGARLVVFPEYSSYFTAAMGADVVPFAQELNGEFSGALGALAAGASTTLCVQVTIPSSASPGASTGFTLTVRGVQS